MPLSCGGPILKLPTPGGGVTPQLPGDRRSRALKAAGDLTDAVFLGPQQSDLFVFAERQEVRRGLTVQGGWPHPASFAEPPRPHRGRHARIFSSTVATAASGDRFPEPLLPPPFMADSRMSRGPQRRAPGIESRVSLWSSHNNTSLSRCCDDQLNPSNSPASATAKDWPRSGPLPRSEPLRIATRMLWPRPSTVTTRPSSSEDRCAPIAVHGRQSKMWSWPLSGGCIGTTLSGFMGTSVTGRQLSSRTCSTMTTSDPMSWWNPYSRSLHQSQCGSTRRLDGGYSLPTG